MDLELLNAQRLMVDKFGQYVYGSYGKPTKGGDIIEMIVDLDI